MYEDFEERMGLKSPVSYADALPTARSTFANKTADDSHELLHTRFTLSEEQIANFKRLRYIRLGDVIPHACLLAIKTRLIEIAALANGGVDVSLPNISELTSDGSSFQNRRKWDSISQPNTKSWHMQMMWAIDETIRSLVLSPRIGDIVCQLLNCSNIRLYHDNCLSRVPGSDGTFYIL